jgi:hypothetical protein
MIIPGLTDVDLSSLANMSIEELDDLETMANERAAEFQMQLEAIQQAGGVSKEQASQFKGILPPQIAMESFTTQVTNTNFPVATEALSTAVKVAIGVAIVAAFGTLIFWVMNANKKKISDINTKMDDDYKKSVAANAAWRERMHAAERDQVIAADAARKAREEARAKVVAAFLESRPSNYVYASIGLILNGMEEPGKSLEDALEKAKLSVWKEYHGQLVPYLDEAVKFANSSSSSLITPKFLMAHANSTFIGWSSMEDLATYLRRRCESMYVKHIAGRMRGGSDEEVRIFLEWATAPSERSDHELTIRLEAMEKRRERKLEPPKLDKYATLVSDIDKVKNDLPKQEKRLADVGVKLPPDFKKALETRIGIAKGYIKMVSRMIDLINLEIAVYNTLVRFAYGVNVEEAKAVRSLIQSEMDDPNTDEDKKKVLAQLLQDIKW